MIGRLAVQGPTGCRYLADERQRDYVQDGWNLTGDAYMTDADGYFFYQARTDDMIISAGYNIAGPEVEEALLRHPAVPNEPSSARPTRSAARSSRRSWCSRGRRGGRRRRRSELQDFVKASIAPYKYPRVIEFVSELPKTISGKTQRYRLRQMAGAKLQARSGKYHGPNGQAISVYPQVRSTVLRTPADASKDPLRCGFEAIARREGRGLTAIVEGTGMRRMRCTRCS